VATGQSKVGDEASRGSFSEQLTCQWANEVRCN